MKISFLILPLKVNGMGVWGVMNVTFSNYIESIIIRGHFRLSVLSVF